MQEFSVADCIFNIVCAYQQLYFGPWSIEHRAIIKYLLKDTRANYPISRQQQRQQLCSAVQVVDLSPLIIIQLLYNMLYMRWNWSSAHLSSSQEYVLSHYLASAPHVCF